MPALRVPCDARMNRRDVKLARAQTVTSQNLRLILCFSAGLNGRLKIKSKDAGLKTKDQRLKTKHSRLLHSGIILAGIHSLKILDTGLRRYDGCVVGRIVLSCEVSAGRY